MFKFNTFLTFIMVILLGACGTYKKNIMLQMEENKTDAEISSELPPNYLIKPGDLLQLKVFTNNGELVLDPDYELTRDLGNNQNNKKPDINYLVNADGSVKFPLLGVENIEGKTLREAELFLQQRYEKFYTKPFVTLQFDNKRVVVIGAVNNVIQLNNENTRLIEVLALADAVDNDAIVQNIRIVRGDETYMLDLSKASDVTKTNLIMQPGDIVYVEPQRRPFIEAVKDYGPIISLVSSITAIVVIISNSGGK